MARPLVIDPRFNGPPGSGQGGYVCGLLARELGAPSTEVTLRVPPPLERELQLTSSAEGAALMDGETLVASARPGEVGLEPVPPVSEADAEAARERYAFHETHPFPTCFGCGPLREEGDGLRLFAGPVEGADGLHATPWHPGDALAGPDGNLPVEILWAALDCPSSFPVTNPDANPPIVLGRLTARFDGPVPAGQPYVIVSWPVGVDGRKRHSGVALHRRDGGLAGIARALWIELRPTS